MNLNNNYLSYTSVALDNEIPSFL